MYSFHRNDVIRTLSFMSCSMRTMCGLNGRTTRSPTSARPPRVFAATSEPTTSPTNAHLYLHTTKVRVYTCACGENINMLVSQTNNSIEKFRICKFMLMYAYDSSRMACVRDVTYNWNCGSRCDGSSSAISSNLKAAR